MCFQWFHKFTSVINGVSGFHLADEVHYFEHTGHTQVQKEIVKHIDKEAVGWELRAKKHKHLLFQKRDIGYIES